MSPILLALITGLTTGGLSCLAVQGGLLASSLAQQLEQQALAGISGAHKRKSKRTQSIAKQQIAPRMASPILLFLGAKLLAYTLLGLFLGWLGSMLTLTVISRAILLWLIGIFMVGNGLRMLDVHPIFRTFAIQPPSFVTRFIRRTAKKDSDTLTPFFLGALTVLIPCGVTQAMMATAMTTGSPLQGAALMFAFTLGTSPVFFLVVYLATQLGARLERSFMRFVAVVILILGLVSIDSGLNLIGFPYTLGRAWQGFTQTEPLLETAPAPGNVVTLTAANDGYFPGILFAQAGEKLTLNVVTDQTRSCARAFVIPALGVETILPETGTVPIEIPPQPAGSTLYFSCSMGMYGGQIRFVE